MGGGLVGEGVKYLLDSAPTSCFLWGGAEITWRLGWIVGLARDLRNQKAI